EMHAHDDLGLATANTLAAVRAGATHVNTTVHGLGERAGNAALEEVVMGLKHVHRVATGVDLTRFEALSKLVAQASGHAVGWHKSLVGDGAFTHEAGIHVDGLLKDPLNYQGIDPAEVGRKHQIVLGKHSGRQAIRLAYEQLLQLDINAAQAERVLPLLRRFVTETKRPPERNDLQRFLDQAACLPLSLSDTASEPEPRRGCPVRAGSSPAPAREQEPREQQPEAHRAMGERATWTC
ncbi:homocitrate synthase/isopropylmalate synthase family protein, partial [Halochromatium sp.]